MSSQNNEQLKQANKIQQTETCRCGCGNPNIVMVD